MKRTREQIVDSLENAKKRLKDLQERGNEVISAYDLMMGYDANFYLNICTLPQNHINYYTQELEEFDRNDPYRNQLSLF